MAEIFIPDPESESVPIVDSESLDRLQRSQVVLATAQEIARLVREGALPAGEVIHKEFLIRLDDGTVTTSHYGGFIAKEE